MPEKSKRAEISVPRAGGGDGTASEASTIDATSTAKAKRAPARTKTPAKKASPSIKTAKLAAPTDKKTTTPVPTTPETNSTSPAEPAPKKAAAKKATKKASAKKKAAKAKKATKKAKAVEPKTAKAESEKPKTAKVAKAAKTKAEAAKKPAKKSPAKANAKAATKEAAVAEPKTAKAKNADDPIAPEAAVETKAEEVAEPKEAEEIPAEAAAKVEEAEETAVVETKKVATKRAAMAKADAEEAEPQAEEPKAEGEGEADEVEVKPETAEDEGAVEEPVETSAQEAEEAAEVEAAEEEETPAPASKKRATTKKAAKKATKKATKKAAKKRATKAAARSAPLKEYTFIGVPTFKGKVVDPKPTQLAPPPPPPKQLTLEERLEILHARLAKQREPVRRKIQEQLDMSWIYHDSALEGVVYSYKELKIALGPDQTLVQESNLQPTIDEIRRHRAAIEFVREAAKKKTNITVDLIKRIYLQLHPEEGDVKSVKYRKDIPQHRLYFHEYLQPDKITARVRQIVEWVNESGTRKGRHAIRIAARTHYDLLRAFPFLKDSGKVARLLMNLLLLQAGYEPAIIHSTERQRYYDALKAASPTMVISMVTEAEENAVLSLERLLDGIDLRRGAG